MIGRLLLDVDSEAVLFHEDADAPHLPASLLKMLTLYALFEDLAAGRVSLGDSITMSQRATSLRGSGVGLRPGDEISVHEAITCIAVVSANDIATAAAEHMAGSVRAFVERMQDTAQKLGLTNTFVSNPSGMTKAGAVAGDLASAGQSMTAEDAGKLALRLYKDFPGSRPWYAMPSIVLRGKRWPATNPLLTRTPYQGCTGLKTGSLPVFATFNMAATAVRDGRTMLAVVMSCPTKASRRDEAIRLLDRGFFPASGT